MIRAVFENGEVRLLDPAPTDWPDGQSLIVERAPGPDAVHGAEIDTAPDVATWYAELVRLGSFRYEPGEKEEIDALMREMDEAAKEGVRKEMSEW